MGTFPEVVQPQTKIEEKSEINWFLDIFRGDGNSGISICDLLIICGTR